MSRRIKTHQRTISNRGPVARFIGYLPSDKRHPDQPTAYLPFDSIAALKVALYLEWLPSTVHLAFEPDKHLWANAAGESVSHVPDFRVTRQDGDIGYVEGKYDFEALSDELRQRALDAKKELESRGHSYQVISRTALEANGFIDTIAMLRRYGRLSFPEETLARTERALKADHPLTLTEYQRNARIAGLSLPVVYWLLYHQRLPLTYEPFVHPEFALCRV